MSTRIDPELLQQMMRSNVGRGITTVPVSGAGLNDDKRQYHLSKPREKPEQFKKSVLDALREKITDI